jgi:hypothetical protein
MKLFRVVILSAALGGASLAGLSRAEATLTPLPVKTSLADEYAPAADGAWFTWTQSSHTHPNRFNVFARRNSGPKIKVNPAGTDGAGGGIDGSTLVYGQSRGNIAGDIRKFNLKTHRRSDFPSKVSSRWHEYHPTISKPWVLFSRYISTTRTTKVFLFNMKTGALRMLGAERGRHREVYSGQVNGDYAAWGRVRPGGQDVFLYRISTKENTRLPRPVFAQYHPAVAADGTIYYERSGNACGASVSLIRKPPDGSAAVLHTFPDGIDGGYGYVQERTDGTLHWFFVQVKCRSGRWDIYKVIDSFNVSVSKQGTGIGGVTSDPVGIDCGVDCQATFHGGTTVTLTATPDTGSVFSGWSDPSCGTNASCPVILESDVSLTATFETGP